MLKLYEETHHLRLVSCIIMFLEFCRANKVVCMDVAAQLVDEVNLLINMKTKEPSPT